MRFFLPSAPDGAARSFSRVALIILDDRVAQIPRNDLLHVENAVGGGNDFHGYALAPGSPTPSRFSIHRHVNRLQFFSTFWLRPETRALVRVVPTGRRYRCDTVAESDWCTVTTNRPRVGIVYV